MEHIIAVKSEGEFRHYHKISQEIQSVLEPFLKLLKTEYAAADLPNSIVWTSLEIATQSISSIPLPGYTNEFRTVFCPDLAAWRNLYLKQLKNAEIPEVRRYYETRLTENHILQILGHEFVHHSGLFIDEAYEKARWFEEGMCEYISRTFFLSEDQFLEEAHINAILVNHFQARNEEQPLEEFTAATYANSIAAILYEYWRSFLTVHQIIDRFQGDIHAVFRSYREWYQQASAQPLSEWFQISI